MAQLSLAPVDPHGLPGERRRRRPAVPGHGVLLVDARPAVPGRAAAARRGALDRRAHRQRRRDRAPAGRAAPRHQAVEHPDHGVRPSRCCPTSASPRRSARSETSEAVGLSIPWSAPEVLHDDVSGTVASEVWSLGATVYSLLAGRSPFEIPGGDNAHRSPSWRASRRRSRRRSGGSTCRRASSASSPARCREASAGPPGQRARVHPRPAVGRGGARPAADPARGRDGRLGARRRRSTSTSAPASAASAPSPTARADAGARADPARARRAPCSAPTPVRTTAPARRTRTAPPTHAAPRLGHLGRGRAASSRSSAPASSPSCRARRGIPVVTDVQGARRRHGRDVHLERPGHRERRRLHRHRRRRAPADAARRRASTSTSQDGDRVCATVTVDARRQVRRAERRAVRRRRGGGRVMRLPRAGRPPIGARDGGRGRRRRRRRRAASPWCPAATRPSASTSATPRCGSATTSCRRSGRANTAVLELNSVVETGGSAVEVVQQGSTVLVLDRDRASVGIVDATTSTVTEAGRRAARGHRGRPRRAIAWSSPPTATCGSAPAAGFADFDGDADPVLNFGAGAVTSVDPAGVLFAYTPTTGAVARVDAADEETVGRAVAARRRSTTTPTCRSRRSASTGWCSTPTARTLWVEGREVDLVRTCSRPPTTRPAGPGARGRIRSPSRIAAGSSRSASTAARPSARRRRGRRSGRADRSTTDASTRRGAPARPGARCPGEDAEPRRARRRDRRRRPDVPRERRCASCSTIRESGATWAAVDDYGLIDNWDALLAHEQDEETIEQNDPDDGAHRSRRARCRRSAVDDAFGARPGRSTLLPVLLNDYDANGDVLVIDGVDGELPAGRAARPRVGQPAAAADARRRGIRCDRRSATPSATAAAARRTRSVTVTVRDPEENSPPGAAAREPRRRRERRARHDGGARRLGRSRRRPVLPALAPSVAEPDALSSTAEGVVVFDEQRRRRRQARASSLVVSDGRDAAGGVLTVAVRAPGDVPLIAEPFVALATAGQEISIDPLAPRARRQRARSA